MRRRSLTLLTIGLALCLSTMTMAAPGSGDPAIDFTLNDVNGTAHSLSDYQGKVIILNFWTSW